MGIHGRAVRQRGEGSGDLFGFVFQDHRSGFPYINYRGWGRDTGDQSGGY